MCRGSSGIDLVRRKGVPGMVVMRLGFLQRVVLLDFDKATNRISFRHFSIVVQPCGVTKSVKTLIGKRKVPDLGNFQDVAEFLTKSGYGSVPPPPSLVASRR
jgi:hypothetical protein